MGFLNGVIKALGLDPNDRAVAKYEKKTEIIDSLEPDAPFQNARMRIRCKAF